MMNSGVRQLVPKVAAVISMLLFVALTACHTTEGDVSLPQEARDFIYKYFPLDYIHSKEELPSGDYQVEISDGPTLIFDSTGSWIDLRGNGSTLPQMIAFDYFPEALYDYIESLEQISSIYSVSRDARTYEVLLFDTRLTYTISTGKVTQTDI